jgi:protein-disulfide isomerase
VLEKYPKQVKLVFKNFPLTSSHPFAYMAATAALAADAQGKFWEFHNKLFENQRMLNEAKIQEIATELKLDIKKFNRDMKAPAIQKLIARDMEDGRQARITEIPTVFINGKLPRGRPQSLEDLVQGIEDRLEAELKKEKK